MSTEKKTIACFGATGGCVGAALACALREGHHCTALARTPEKLRNVLANDHDLSPSVIGQHLTIVQGDVKDPAAVAKVLVSPVDEHALVDVIISGVGAYPTFQWSIRRPLPLTDPTICENTIQTIFTALENLSSAASVRSPNSKPLDKPLLIVISTAGCGRRRGVPLSIYLPYHYFLSSPLADKKQMERVVLADNGAHVRDFVIMRPPFLTSGESRGDDALQIGWEWGVEAKNKEIEEPGPVVGYQVSRKDVGAWIFGKAIVQGEWDGKCIYLTY